MNHRTRNRALMRRLGFEAEPANKPQIMSAAEATHWRHQPSNTLVVTFHQTRYTEEQVVRGALGWAIQHALSIAGDKVSAVIASMRRANEEEAVERWRSEQALRRSNAARAQRKP